MSSSKYHKRRQRKPKSKTKWMVMAIALLAVVVTIVVLSTMPNETAPNENNVPISNQVMFQTSVGNILIELRDDMPITTTNFKNLVNDGIYDNTLFHRVDNTPNSLVMIQGGNPYTNENYQGPTIPTIQDEFSEDTENNKNVRGTIAMANRGANTGSSQFFINGDYNSHLDNVHPVFGEVIEGMDVVDQILNVDTDSEDSPLTPVVLISAYLVQET